MGNHFTALIMVATSTNFASSFLNVLSDTYDRATFHLVLGMFSLWLGRFGR